MPIKKPAFKKPVDKITDKTLVNHIFRILQYFDEYSAPDPFGWDWPTMRVLFPELCDDYASLIAEGRLRITRTGVLNGLAYNRETFQSKQDAA